MARWVGRILSGLAVLFLLFDATVKLLKVDAAVEATTKLPLRAATRSGTSGT